MYSPQYLEKLRKETDRWRDQQDSSAQRKPSFKTPSQIPVDQVYIPGDITDQDYLADQGLPGEYPYLRLSLIHI